VKLNRVELRRIHLSLVAPFETSFGVQTERDVLLVKAITTEGEGWGECVAGEEPTYSPEYVDGAQHALINHLLPNAAGPIIIRLTYGVPQAIFTEFLKLAFLLLVRFARYAAQG